jgi:hypothetical protein
MIAILCLVFAGLSILRVFSGYFHLSYAVSVLIGRAAGVLVGTVFFILTRKFLEIQNGTTERYLAFTAWAYFVMIPFEAVGELLPPTRALTGFVVAIWMMIAFFKTFRPSLVKYLILTVVITLVAVALLWGSILALKMSLR